MARLACGGSERNSSTEGGAPKMAVNAGVHEPIVWLTLTGMYLREAFPATTLPQKTTASANTWQRGRRRRQALTSLRKSFLTGVRSRAAGGEAFPLGARQLPTPDFSSAGHCLRPAQGCGKKLSLGSRDPRTTQREPKPGRYSHTRRPSHSQQQPTRRIATSSRKRALFATGQGGTQERAAPRPLASGRASEHAGRP